MNSANVTFPDVKNLKLDARQRAALDRLDLAKSALKITVAMRYLISIGLAVETFNYSTRKQPDGTYAQQTSKSGRCLITDQGIAWIREQKKENAQI